MRSHQQRGESGAVSGTERRARLVLRATGAVVVVPMAKGGVGEVSGGEGARWV